MKFYNGYEINISSIKNSKITLFEMSISLHNQKLFDIKMDLEFILTLYSLIDEGYINSIPFGIRFPLQSTMEVYDFYFGICAKDQDYYMIEISRTNIHQQTDVYNIKISFDEVYELLFEIFSIIDGDYYQYSYINCEDTDDIAEINSFIIGNTKQSYNLNYNVRF